MAADSPVCHVHVELKSNPKLTRGYGELWPRDGEIIERPGVGTAKRPEVFENPQFSKTMQLSNSGAGHRMAFIKQLGVRDSSNKESSLQNAIYKCILAKKKAKDKEDESIESKSSRCKSKVRDLKDSRALLSLATKGQAHQGTFEANQTQLLNLKNFKFPMPVNIPDGDNKKAGIDSSDKHEVQEMRYFTGRCKSLNKLASKRPRGSHSDLSAVDKAGRNTSMKFMNSINGWINQLETTQRAVSFHKRGKSSIDLLKCRHTSTVSQIKHSDRGTDANISANTVGNAADRQPSKGSKKRRRSSHDSSRKMQDERPSEIDTLIAQNDDLRHKITKLKCRIKDESAGGRYWKAKYDDLERRYNEIIMQSVRARDDTSTERRSAGGRHAGVDSRHHLLTTATADSNFKTDTKR